MNRRDLMTLIGGAAAWPLAARAQQPALPVIGHLGGASSEASQLHLAALRAGLGEAGYVVGRNVTIEPHIAERQYDRLAALAGDLVRRRVAVITAAGIPAARAAKAATASIPIVFVFGEDPVQEGIVASLNRPGGNITGFSWLANQLTGKRLGLLTEIVPGAAVLAFLVDANNPVSDPDARDAKIAAAALGRRLELLAVGSDADLDTAFASMVERQVGGLAVDVVPFFLERREQVIALAARHRIPTIYDERLFATAGGLLSYGPDQADSWRQGGVYVGRILKGEKPAELPVQQATKLDFVVNLKTARALGLDLPPNVVARADEVIE